MIVAGNLHVVEIDCGSLTHDEVETKRYGARTVAYVTESLGSASTGRKVTDPCDVLNAFRSIAERIRTGCSAGRSFEISRSIVAQLRMSLVDTRARTLNELVRYTNRVCQLQSDRQRALPSVEKHLADRRQTGGAAISIGLIEYLFLLCIIAVNPLLDEHLDMRTDSKFPNILWIMRLCKPSDYWPTT